MPSHASTSALWGARWRRTAVATLALVTVLFAATTLTASAAVSTVTGISPNRGPVGRRDFRNHHRHGFLTGGTGGTAATGVLFGTDAATFTVDDDTHITATSPPHAAGTVHVTVANADGSSAETAADQFTYQAAATITTLTTGLRHHRRRDQHRHRRHQLHGDHRSLRCDVWGPECHELHRQQ